MRDKITKILHEDFDWVGKVDEYENFFTWFKKDGPGKKSRQEPQEWIEYTQNVEYAMSHLEMDISEMLSYSKKIQEGNVTPNTMYEYLDYIHEFVYCDPHSKGDIENYVLELKDFINKFGPYFGDNSTFSDMVEMVHGAMEYAQENHIKIYNTKTTFTLFAPEGPVNEDFDWAIKDTVPFLEIGEPLKRQNPRKHYRLHVSHGVGQDNSTWVPNWGNYDPTRSLDTLVRHIKILSWLQENYREGTWGLSDLWLEGEEWVLSDEDNKNIRKTMEDEGWTIEENGEDIRDYIWEWLSDELMDYGLREYDSYHEEDATIEDWRVTYFDEFGVEHAVKVNLPK
jgi:hypothetical protein